MDFASASKGRSPTAKEIEKPGQVSCREDDGTPRAAFLAELPEGGFVRRRPRSFCELEGVAPVGTYFRNGSRSLRRTVGF